MSYRDHLAHRMNVLRTLLKAPHDPYTRLDKKFVAVPGFVGLEHNQFSGYRVFEITNVEGGERNLCEGLKVHECINFINGAIMALEGRLSMFGDTND